MRTHLCLSLFSSSKDTYNEGLRKRCACPVSYPAVPLIHLWRLRLIHWGRLAIVHQIGASHGQRAVDRLEEARDRRVRFEVKSSPIRILSGKKTCTENASWAWPGRAWSAAPAAPPAARGWPNTTGNGAPRIDTRECPTSDLDDLGPLFLARALRSIRDDRVALPTGKLLQIQNRPRNRAGARPDRGSGHRGGSWRASRHLQGGSRKLWKHSTLGGGRAGFARDGGEDARDEVWEVRRQLK